MKGQFPRPSYDVSSIAAMIVVVGIALATDFPVLISPRGTPRYNWSINNLKNLGLAIYESASVVHGVLPFDRTGKDARSWRVELLQYVDRADLHRTYNRSVPWDTSENAEISRTQLPVFDATEGGRSEPVPVGWGNSDYGMISGPGTVQPDDCKVRLDEIAKGDGLGNTLMLGECVGLRLDWAEPRDPRVDREIMGIELLTQSGQTSNRLLSTYTTSGVPVGFADGAARLLSHKIDPKILAALCTIHGGEPIGQQDFIP